MAQRNTKQRELILDVVRSRYDHPTAEQIYASVHEIDPSVGKATVYRNLHLLAAQGDIMEIDAQDASHFDLRADTHYHMQCGCCGEVVDVPLEKLDFPYDLIEQMTGYKVKGHHIMFQGICPSCQDTAQKAV